MVAFVDPHITFIRSDACASVWDALAADPTKWAAAFMEQPRRRPGDSSPFVQRTRMHSLFVAFDAIAMREHFPIELFVRTSSLEERLRGLLSEAAACHYRTHLVLDNLSLPTEYLRSNFDQDRILALDELVGQFHEGSMLTVVSDRLVHVKHQEPGAQRSLRDALAASELDTDSCEPLRRLVAACHR